jgi:two-component sensor histidine kinase
MKLIRAFARQLGGHYSFEMDNGMVFRLVIPAERLSEAVS